jgi:two-component system, chemotaxis family, sensor kinase CheA
VEQPFDLSSLLGEFRDEAREQLDRLDAALLAIEEGGSIAPADVTSLLRNLHTLKGNSGMLGLRPLVDAVHAMEGVFKDAEPAFSRERLDLLFEAAAAARQAVEQAGTGTQEEAFSRLTSLHLAARLESSVGAWAGGGSEHEEAPAEAAPARGRRAASGEDEGAARGDDAEAESEPGEAAGEFMRVPFAKLDQLLDQVGELTGVAASLRALLKQHEDLLDEGGAAHPFAEMAEQLGRTARALRTSTMEIRLVPVQRVFSRFPSLARDLAREQGKRVRVVVEGGGVELDRSMVEALGDPLLHLVRNAVDHGIRPPEEREAGGKPAAGTIVLRAERRGDRVRVEVADDGPGLDLDALRRTARTLGLVGDHSILSPEEAAEMIFRPGFSTRTSSDTVSGRGIGLDAVKQRVTALRGTLSVETPAEGGTRFALDLPLTLAILPALIFEAEGGTFALPAVSVERTLHDPIAEMAGAAEVLRHENDLIPVARAGRVFGWDGEGEMRREGGGRFAVVVRSGTRRGAVLATRLIDQRDLVVKALPHYLGRVPGVSGASVAPDGGVILLLDPAGLLDLNLALHQRENRGLKTSQDSRRRG